MDMKNPVVKWVVGVSASSIVLTLRFGRLCPVKHVHVHIGVMQRRGRGNTDSSFGLRNPHASIQILGVGY